MLAYISALLSWLAGRFRGRAELELEVIALRHQLAVLRRQRPGRLRLSALDRLLWTWLYRGWPRCLNILVLVKPATVVQWHRQGFRLYWRFATVAWLTLMVRDGHGRLVSV
jgi:putative transposase